MNIYLGPPYINGQGFRMSGLNPFIGGLVANEFYASLNPYPSEIININGSSGNALNVDPSQTIVCSNAPNFTVSAYNSVTQQAAGSATMTDCTAAPFTPVSSAAPAALTTPGLRAFTFSYTTGDGTTYLASLNATLYTDGTANFDGLGNVYYSLLQITGSRTYTVYYTSNGVTLSNTSTHAINGLMSQGMVPFGTGPDGGIIYNNNRIYPYFPLHRSLWYSDDPQLQHRP